MKNKTKKGKIIIINNKDKNESYIHFITIKSKNDLSFQLCLSINNKEFYILFNAFKYSFKYNKKYYYVYFLDIPYLIKIDNKMKKFLISYLS